MPTVTFTLKNFLVEENQRQARGLGLPVPTSKQLAKACGMSEVTFSRMINNDRDAIPLKALATIITELRWAGFEVHFDDLFRYDLD